MQPWNQSGQFTTVSCDTVRFWAVCACWSGVWPGKPCGSPVRTWEPLHTNRFPACCPGAMSDRPPETSLKAVFRTTSSYADKNWPTGLNLLNLSVFSQIASGNRSGIEGTRLSRAFKSFPRSSITPCKYHSKWLALSTECRAVSRGFATDVLLEAEVTIWETVKPCVYARL